MQCRRCGAPTRVLATRKQGEVTLRFRQCDADPEHRLTTYEIDESMWRVAQHDIQKSRKAATRRISRVAKVAAMRKDRLAGMGCPAIAKKYGISVDMARYYTRIPRADLYPGVRSEQRRRAVSQK